MVYVHPDTKDPQSTELYGFDFRTVLAENEIDPARASGHQILAPAGLTVHSSHREGAAVSARIAGGEAGQIYRITFRLLVEDPETPTAPPLMFDRTLQIRVEQQ